MEVAILFPAVTFLPSSIEMSQCNLLTSSDIYFQLEYLHIYLKRFFKNIFPK